MASISRALRSGAVRCVSIARRRGASWKDSNFEKSSRSARHRKFVCNLRKYCLRSHPVGETLCCSDVRRNVPTMSLRSPSTFSIRRWSDQLLQRARIALNEDSSSPSTLSQSRICLMCFLSWSFFGLAFVGLFARFRRRSCSGRTLRSRFTLGRPPVGCELSWPMEDKL
jgi:hypothetical protein